MRSFLAFTATLGLGVLATLMWLAPVWNYADLFRQFWAPLTLAALLAALAVVIFDTKRQRWGAPLLALLIAAPGLPETVVSLTDIPLTPPAGTPVTVVTHNLWGRNATPEAATERIIEMNGDIVALQEAFGTAWVVPELLEETYPNRADCDRYASVVVTRLPIVESGCLDWWWWRSLEGQREAPFFHAPPASWATILLRDGREVTVVSVHMTWPDPLAHQDEQREGLAFMLQAFPQDSLIVMGDFNSAAPSQALARFERDLGLERITRGRATWPSESLWANRAGMPSPVPTMMTGIDHVFVGERLMGWSVETGLDTGSDHRPVEARLILFPERAED